MSITILHGEYEKASREALFVELEKAKSAGKEILRKEASELTESELEEKLGSTSLFTEAKTVTIEGLHSLPKSKKKDALILLLSKADASTDIVLWERKKLTAAQLKKFPSAVVKEFTIPSSIFVWLDHIQDAPKQKLRFFRKALEQEEADFCFAMLARQVRLLLLSKSGAQMKEHPFVVKKISAQARHFEIEELILLHEKLTQTDYKLKTGQLAFPLQQALEEIMLS